MPVLMTNSRGRYTTSGPDPHVRESHEHQQGGSTEGRGEQEARPEIEEGDDVAAERRSDDGPHELDALEEAHGAPAATRVEEVYDERHRHREEEGRAQSHQRPGQDELTRIDGERAEDVPNCVQEEAHRHGEMVSEP